MAGDEQPPKFNPDDIQTDANGNLFWIDPELRDEMEERRRNRPPADPEAPVKDGMHPPSIPEMVHCIHCGQEYDSWRIEWRVFESPDGTTHGMWCCPIDGCDGRGFGIDIYPVDFPPDGCWQDADGREIQEIWDDDEDEGDEDWDEEEDFPDPAGPPAEHFDDGLSDDDIPF